MNIFTDYFASLERNDIDFPLDALTVYELSNEKIRFGKTNDGGYVILDGFSYGAFISCGIGYEESFERDFALQYDMSCLAFDGTIDCYPNPNTWTTFTKKNISDVNTENTTNLHSTIEHKDNIFLKMDIEGNEYKWIHSLTKDQLQKFKQIVIEFHFPFDEYRWNCLERLNETHWLCHFHPNNHAADCIKWEQGNGCRRVGDVEVPRIFECTYINKDDVNETITKNKKTIPAEIDNPNNPKIRDIFLQGYPYTQ